MIWFGLVLWHINHCRLFNAKSYLYIYIKCMIDIFKWPLAHCFHTVKFFHLFLSNTNTQLNIETVLLQTIQFSISVQFLVYTQLSISIQFFVYRHLNDQTVLFHAIQFSMSTQFFVYTQLNDQTVLFHVIQFKYTVSMSNSSIWPIDRTLSVTTTVYLVKNVVR